jgi:hypothetical protein
MSNPSYPTLPIRPQLIRNAPLISFFLKGDPDKIRPLIPSPLSAHPSGRIVLNMWSQTDPNQTTGFGGLGAMNVTYLAAEVTGEEGTSADGSVRFPGRYWLQHWSNYAPAREYGRVVSGLDIMAGETEFVWDGPRLRARFSLDGRLAISAQVRAPDVSDRTVSGHSIYYAQRNCPAGGAEVAQFVVPWISDVLAADDAKVEFAFPDASPVLSLLNNGLQTVEAVTLRRITLLPYLTHHVLQR